MHLSNNIRREKKKSIRDTLESWVISLPHIFSDIQVADVFTKALTRQRHQFLVDKLLLIDLPASI